MQHSWRDRYIALLTELPPSSKELSKEELQALEDLIEVGYIRGDVALDHNGTPNLIGTRGITLKGRLFMEEQKTLQESRSFWGRIKSSSVLIFGWVSGIFSALIVYYLTKG